MSTRPTSTLAPRLATSHVAGVVALGLIGSLALPSLAIAQQSATLPSFPPRRAAPAEVAPEAAPATLPVIGAPAEAGGEAATLPVITSPQREVSGAPAAPTSSTLQVRTDTECASPASRVTLIDELRRRLPEHVTLVERAEAPGPEQRDLSWGWQADSGCRLILTDPREGVVVLPLAADASVESVRQAVVRVVWFMALEPAMVEPEAAPVVAEVEVEEPKLINGLPMIAPRGTGLLSPVAPVVLPAEPVAVAAANDALTPATPSNEVWRGEGGDLYAAGTLFSRDAPLRLELRGVEREVRFNGGFTTDITGLNALPAWLFSLRAGARADDRFGVGLSYKWLSTTLLTDRNWAALENPPPDAFDEQGRMSLHLVGGDAELVMLSMSRLELVGSVGLHLGRIKTTALSGEGEVGSMLVLGEAQTQVLGDVFPWLKLGMGLGYRAPLLQGNDWVASPRDLRGFSATFTMRVALF